MAVEQTEGNRYAELAKLDPILAAQLEAESSPDTVKLTPEATLALADHRLAHLDKRAQTLAFDGDHSSFRQKALSSQAAYDAEFELLTGRPAGEAFQTAASGMSPLPERGSLPGVGFGSDGINWLGRMVLDSLGHDVTMADLSKRLDDYYAEALSKNHSLADIENAFVGTASDYQLKRGIPMLQALAEFGSKTAEQLLVEANVERQLRLDNGGREAQAIADRAVWDVARSGLAVIDTPTAAFRMFGKGEYNWENGLTLAGAVAAPVLKVGGKIVGNGVEVAVESATARAARLGAEGEQAVGLYGPKVGIRVPGANNLRFPDNLTTTTLTEVKNVASQGLTKQLRDYITISQSTGRTFELWVRPSTHLTPKLEAAILRGDMIRRFIPGAK